MQQRYGKKYSEYQAVGHEDESEPGEPTTSVPATTPALVPDIEDFGASFRRSSKLHDEDFAFIYVLFLNCLFFV